MTGVLDSGCSLADGGLPAPYYQDDHVTIYHGDSRGILQLIEAAAVMVTDPPYGYAYASNKGGHLGGEEIANDRDTTARDAVLEAWGSRPALVFGSWKRERPTTAANVLVWDKGDQPGMGDLKLPWGHSHEEVYVLGSGFEGKRSGSVLRFDRVPQARQLHQNEKPVPLMRELIAKCPPGLIVDPFMGSGATLRAAKDLGRRAIGIDVDAKWCQIAAERCSQEVLDVA